MARKLRPARAYQHPRAPIVLVRKYGQRRLRRTVREALGHLHEVFDVKRAKQLVATGFAARFIAHHAVDWTHYREIIKAVFEEWAKVYEAGARLGAAKINRAFKARRRAVRFRKVSTGSAAGELTTGGAGAPGSESVDNEFLAQLFADDKSFRKDIGDRFTFDRFTPEVQQELRDAQDELIVELEAQVRDTIQQVVMRGQTMGESVDEIVSDIREVISLTATQSNAVLNYENMLRSLDSTALQRGLRNTALDDVVQAAIDDGASLSEATIAGAVADYESNYLDYRANAIAKTESVRASNYGLRESYRQAVDKGALTDDAVKRFWQVDLTENTCPVCLSIPDLNPDGVGIDDDFDSSDGPQDDPPVHVSCACSVEYVTDLDQVPDDESGAVDE